MRKQKGRKIKHTKRLYRVKKPLWKRVLKSVIILVIVAGLIFAGYSAAGPIIDFFSKIDDKSNSSSEAWKPNKDSVSSLADNNSKKDDSSKNSSEPDDKDITTNKKSFNINNTSLNNITTLKQSISAAKQNGYTEAIVELKSATGILNYKSNNNIAIKAKAVKGTLDIKTIFDTISEQGLKPVAKINVLNDNLAPKVDSKIGYVFEKGGYAWHDEDPAKGGKRWMSPFSEETKEYLKDLTNEITTAGFSEIVLTGLIFPDFKTWDVNWIGTIVKDEALKNKELTVLAKSFKTWALGKAKVYLEVSAVNILTGQSKVFIPTQLGDIPVKVNLDLATIPNEIQVKGKEAIQLAGLNNVEKVKSIFSAVKTLSGNVKILPVINAKGISEEDYKTLKSYLSTQNYMSFIINK